MPLHLPLPKNTRVFAVLVSADQQTLIAIVPETVKRLQQVLRTGAPPIVDHSTPGAQPVYVLLTNPEGLLAIRIESAEWLAGQACFSGVSTPTTHISAR